MSEPFSIEGKASHFRNWCADLNGMPRPYPKEMAPKSPMMAAKAPAEVAETVWEVVDEATARTGLVCRGGDCIKNS